MDVIRAAAAGAALLLVACGSDSEDGSVDPGAMPSGPSTPIVEEQPDPGTPAVPDPMTRNETQVAFEITVPAYMSDELQVLVSWDDRTLVAEWIGDELWRATGAFPADAEHRLRVELRDRNGDITLGSVERPFRTGTNAAEEVVIEADDFDTARWDDDRDGTSNIDELRAGTDPRTADGPMPPGELFERTDFSRLDLYRTVGAFEPDVLTIDLPAAFSDQVTDEREFSARVESLTVDLSARGNGTLSRTVDFSIELDADTRYVGEGTRSVDGDSVRWTATESFDGDASRRSTFDITSTLDGDELVQSGRGTLSEGPLAGNLTVETSYAYEVVLDLDSMDDENRCEALRGTVTETEDRRGIGGEVLSITATKGTSDARWAVSGDRLYDFTYPDGAQAESLDVRFYCNFGFDRP